MADTRRSLADLLANLFQDGQTEGISAQDMRDLIKSFEDAHGDCYISAAAATTISVAGTFVKVEGTTTFHDDPIDTDANSVNNRIRYTGAVPVHVHLHCSLSLTATQSNRLLTIGIYVYDASLANGSIQAKSKITQKIASGADQIAIACGADIHLDTNDYVEVWITDEDGANDITVQQMYLSMNGGVA